MKTIKKAIALVLTALMVLSLVPATGVSAGSAPVGMTLAEFSAELTPRMGDFYANITVEQETILTSMGDSLTTSSLNPFTQQALNPAWDTILSGLLTTELNTKYGSATAAKDVLAKAIYSVAQLMFYKSTSDGTDAEKLDAAITNAYTYLYLPMDELSSTVNDNVIVSHILTQVALSTILSEVKSTISSQLSSYANAITGAMSTTSTNTYVNTIANSIASVALTNLFTNAAAGSTLDTLKINFLTNAGFTPTKLGDLVKKIYVATASVDSAQNAPSVQFNLLINSIITFQGAKKDTNPTVVLQFDQAITLNSATGNEVEFKINPNRTIAGIDLDMTSYFVVSSPDDEIISATKYEDQTFGGYYIKLKAMPNVVHDGTYYVNVYRNSVSGERYFFNVKVNVVGTGIDKPALTTAITDAETLIASKTVGIENGNVPQAAKDDFQAVIDSAIVVKNNASATKADVDGAIAALATATTAFNNAIINIILVDKAALTTAITNAETLIASKTVGMANGNVTQPTKNAYQTAINTAKAVKNNADATQTDVDAAVIALATATTAFNNAIISGVTSNILLKRITNDGIVDANFSETFATVTQATNAIKTYTDAVKLTDADRTIRYFAVPLDGVTPIVGRNMGVGKVLVCDELSDNTLFPSGSIVWASTNPGKKPILSNSDYYTVGVNAFPTIPEAITAASSGAEVVIKDGNYSLPAGYTISKKVIIRNGSNPVITGDMIFAAAAAGSTIQGITFGTGVGGGLLTITVDSPNITIANLTLDNVALVVNATGVAIQNVTAINPPAGTPVIEVNSNNTTISGFSFTEDNAAAGAAITVAAGVTNTTITDSVVVDNATTITFGSVDPSNTDPADPANNIHDAAAEAVVNPANTGTEDDVVLNVRRVASADPTKIKTVVYLTDIDDGKDIDVGHAVIGYSLKTLSNPIVTASTNYNVFDSVANANTGILEVAYNKGNNVDGFPTTVNIDGVPTKVIDLFEVTYDLPAVPEIGDVYSIWLSQTSPNNELWRTLTEGVPGEPGNEQPDPLPMLYKVSSAYILEAVPPISYVTLTVRIQLPFEVKNNITQAEQAFNVDVTNSVTGAVETFDIYTGANVDGTHAGATLVALARNKVTNVFTALTTNDTNAYVAEYTLTLPNYIQGTQYDVAITGEGYAPITRNVTLNTDLAVTVWNNIRSTTGANFLAGDVAPAELGDTEPVNNSDFAAMAGQYLKAANAPAMVKYDLNRDKKVSILDIVYLLDNTKNFRLTY